jgi:hypothetical protein
VAGRETDRTPDGADFITAKAAIMVINEKMAVASGQS